MRSPSFGFKAKDCEKRNVSIPDALIAKMDARSQSGSCSLLFGNNGRLDGHLLRILKRVAFDGGLNCGKCKGTVGGKEVSCAEAPVCEKWILHLFRKNFATDRHNGGASARKIQKWLGHSSLETTFAILRSATTPATRCAASSMVSTSVYEHARRWLKFAPLTDYTINIECVGQWPLTAGMANDQEIR